MALTRRAMVGGLAAGLAGVAAQQTTDPAAPGFRRGRGPKPRTTPAFCAYTDQFPDELGYEEMARMLPMMGFDGCDLAVQPGGHIDPAHADLHFMRAIEAMTGSGLDVFMVSTPYTSPADPTVRLTMQWGGEMGVPFYRPGHWKYEGAEIEQRMGEMQRDISGFANIARIVGMSVGIHNATPDLIGASIFDTNMIIRGMDPHVVGYDFDTGYAVAQGGIEGFSTALRLATPRLKMVTARDCYFSKEGGAWKLVECPLGEGMVDWPGFFRTLATARFNGPISVQVGYQPKDLLGAIRKDLAFLKKQSAAAYGG
jgi:L-ribulose-5-phosphate 3-epimerase